MHNWKYLTIQAVQSGFPEFDGIDVQVRKGFVEGGFMESGFEGSRNRRRFVIAVHPTMARANNTTVLGSLAHELSHGVLDLRIGGLQSLTLDWLYHIGAQNPLSSSRLLHPLARKYYTYMERSADKLAIERGFGNEMLSFTQWANRLYENNDATEGLTVTEIQRLLK